VARSVGAVVAHPPVGGAAALRFWEDEPMGQPRVVLAQVEPAIALGPLDGRYRGAVAPLVDHLSEAALNRERVHVEVEWLIHLTAHHVVPGAP
jgi:adenylosuccinate lyase